MKDNAKNVIQIVSTALVGVGTAGIIWTGGSPDQVTSIVSIAATVVGALASLFAGLRKES